MLVAAAVATWLHCSTGRLLLALDFVRVCKTFHAHTRRVPKSKPVENSAENSWPLPKKLFIIVVVVSMKANALSTPTGFEAKWNLGYNAILASVNFFELSSVRETQIEEA